jgi:hypothetical protein
MQWRRGFCRAVPGTGKDPNRAGTSLGAGQPDT